MRSREALGAGRGLAPHLLRRHGSGDRGGGRRGILVKGICPPEDVRRGGGLLAASFPFGRRKTGGRGYPTSYWSLFLVPTTLSPPHPSEAGDRNPRIGGESQLSFASDQCKASGQRVGGEGTRKLEQLPQRRVAPT